MHVEGKRSKNRLKITLIEVIKKDLTSLRLIENMTLDQIEGFKALCLSPSSSFHNGEKMCSR